MKWHFEPKSCGLKESDVISMFDTREVKDADGAEYYLIENKHVKDLLNRQKVPMGPEMKLLMFLMIAFQRIMKEKPRLI